MLLVRCIWCLAKISVDVSRFHGSYISEFSVCKDCEEIVEKAEDVKEEKQGK